MNITEIKEGQYRGVAAIRLPRRGGFGVADPDVGAVTEAWRPIVDTPGYEVSDRGRVRNATGYVMRLTPSSGGYLTVCLPRVTRDVHGLVLTAFIGRRPTGYVCRHLDGDRTNNALTNLAWGTLSENQLDSVKHGTHFCARQTHCRNGHEFTEENTRKRGVAGRACRECVRLESQRRRARS